MKNHQEDLGQDPSERPNPALTQVMPESVTVLLSRINQGDRGAFDQLVPLVYHELHRIADEPVVFGQMPSRIGLPRSARRVTSAAEYIARITRAKYSSRLRRE
jgi:hypothetical protein